MVMGPCVRTGQGAEAKGRWEMLKTELCLLSNSRLKTKDKAAAETGAGNGKVNRNDPHGLPEKPQAPFPAPSLPPSLRWPSQPWLHS